jgi:hypothetical protein
MKTNPVLRPRHTHAASVTPNPDGGWRLSIPAGPRGVYRLAQLDDYSRLPRRRFPYAPTLVLTLRARVSAPDLPGTWGFGLWNDPFGLAVGFGGTAWRFPALPQAAWFFHASPPNHLALSDDIPGSGFFAGTFRSPRLVTLLLAPAALGLPLLAIRPLSRLMRRVAARVARQGGASIPDDVTEWHTYRIEWEINSCRFLLDDRLVLDTPHFPRAPLALVIWIDNQYAAWAPDGRLAWGTLENPDAWLEIDSLAIEQK